MKKKTKADWQWLEMIHEMPCMINNEDCGGNLEAHHLTSGGRRLGDKFTIPLCHFPSPLGLALTDG